MHAELPREVIEMSVVTKQTMERTVVGLVLILGSVGCGKSQAATVEAGAAPAAQQAGGCGKDASDPDKQFCITLPAGYKVSPTVDRSSAPLYSEIVTITGPASEDGNRITVGFTSSNWTTYEQQLAADEKSMTTTKSIKVASSGNTPGNDGKWWVYDNEGYHTSSSTAKAADGKSVHCDPSNTTPTPAAMDACKTIRPYPK